MISQIKLITDQREIDEAYAFIKSFPLDYPNYQEWLIKCKNELETGYKSGFLAKNGNGAVIGSIIVQPHKEDRRVLEIKNLRVAHKYENKGLGSLFCALIELYAKDKGFTRLQVDAHASSPVVDFMKKQGFNVEAKEHIYESETLEAIIAKNL